MVSTARQGRHSVREREKNSRVSHNSSRDATLPQPNGNVGRRTSGPRIKAAGESGRSGVDPLHFFRIVWRSSSYLSKVVNILWPFVPAAIIVFFVVPGHNILKFALAYIAMVPTANLVGFAGQELARKMPHTLGVVTETTFGSLVEIVLFLILLWQGEYYVIQAAILGSILATMLLCLGLCFIAGGIRRDESTFDEVISEVGSGLLLTAGVGLAIPTIFERSLTGVLEPEVLSQKTLDISRAIAILFIIAYAVYLWFQTRTHHGIYNAIFEEDEQRDHDKTKDQRKAKLTLTECILALIVAVGLVILIAYILVHQIKPVHTEAHISDPFMGLILVPLVEKAAEHLTAIDEAWDNQMNFALSHVLGATIQTALFNAPLVIIFGWGLQRPEMTLLFEVFDIAMLLLAILILGNFLRDQKTNYLEGFLCVIIYVAIAVTAFYFPNPPEAATEAATGGGH